MEYAFLKTKIGFTSILDMWHIRISADPAYAGPALGEINDMVRDARQAVRDAKSDEDKSLTNAQMAEANHLKSKFEDAQEGFLIFNAQGATVSSQAGSPMPEGVAETLMAVRRSINPARTYTKAPLETVVSFSELTKVVRGLNESVRDDLETRKAAAIEAVETAFRAELAR